MGQGRRYPRGVTVEVVHVGGCAPPQKKTQTSRNSHLNVPTCCCRESMETTRITTMGLTWTGESRTTLSGSVVGAD